MRNKTLTAVLLAVLLAPAAFAGRKEDLERQAQQAAQARKLDEAANAYCELARIDSSRQADCAAARQEANAESRRNDERFQRGVNFFNANQFDDAEHEFKNIRFGSHYGDAQQYLTSRIPQKRQEVARVPAATPTPPPQAQTDQTFNDAVQAYNANNFSTAKTLFSQVRGAKAGEAQTYLTKIGKYESAMNEGDTLARSSNHRQAQSSYEDAARIKPDGPGSPQEKAATEARLANAPPAPTPTPTPAVATGGGDQGGGGGTTVTKPAVRSAAVKEPERPKVDTAKLMKEADTARSKGDNATAKSKYLAVLAQGEDPRARAALDQIQREEEAKGQVQTQPAATPEADVMLVRAIGEYYKGQYTDAETHIKDYLSVNGSKTALSHFFLGVSKLTEYYLHGEADKKLLNDAQASFRIAKSTQGFKPPGEEYISPKILKIYNSL